MVMLHRVSPSSETDDFINVVADVYTRSLSWHIFIYKNVITQILRENCYAKTWWPKVHFKEAFDEYMSPFVERAPRSAGVPLGQQCSISS